MPKEIEPNPAQVRRDAPANRADRPAGKNLRLLHQVDFWPAGHVVAPHELPNGADVKRLLAVGAVAETDEPATGPLDASALPPGAAVTNQLSPGDELPPNTLEPPPPPVQRELEQAGDTQTQPPQPQQPAADAPPKGGKGK